MLTKVIKRIIKLICEVEVTNSSHWLAVVLLTIPLNYAFPSFDLSSSAV
jgi:hypothetical protein